MLQRPISFFRLATKSAIHYKSLNLTLVASVAVLTATLLGALSVGDSMRSGLRNLALDRLGNIQCFMQTISFVNAEHFPSWEEGFSSKNLSTKLKPVVEPAIRLQRVVTESRVEEVTRVSNNVNLIAVSDTFLQQATDRQGTRFPNSLAVDEIVINRSLADELSVQVGDLLTLNLHDITEISGTAVLGKTKEPPLLLPRQKIVAILPDRGIGEMTFEKNQETQYNVFASLSTVQDILDVGNKVNAAFILNTRADSTDWNDGLAEDHSEQLAVTFNLKYQPQLEDFDLKLEKLTLKDTLVENPVPGPEENPYSVPMVVEDHHYYQLESNQLLIPTSILNQLSQYFYDNRPTTIASNLVNSIAKIDPEASGLRIESNYPRYGTRTDYYESAMYVIPSDLKYKFLSREVPYSIATATEPTNALGLMRYTSRQTDRVRSRDCWINEWLAKEIDAQAGDWILVRYFRPDRVDGQEIENSRPFRITGVVPLETTAKQNELTDSTSEVDDARKYQTLFNDRGLTPQVKGISDQRSISNWDAPFELKDEDLITKADDEYYQKYGLTPKLFLSYGAALSPAIFESRFGSGTAMRFRFESIQSEDWLRQSIAKGLQPLKQSQHLVCRPVKSQMIAASSGTTPFDSLFLSLSFFVIAAALILVSLLFRVGIEQRYATLGLYSAMGYSRAQIRRTLLLEFIPIAVLGAVLGIPLGLGYARLLILGLDTWWKDAAGSKFLSLTITPQSLWFGLISGAAVSLVSMFLTIRRMAQQEPLQLLAARETVSSGHRTRDGVTAVSIAGISTSAAIALALTGFGFTGMGRAGMFFGSGMLLLIALCIAAHEILKRGRVRREQIATRNDLLFAWLSICRNPGRSSISIGLLSIATFLIASMGAFQLSPSDRGIGGFDLMAKTAIPLYTNIGFAVEREERLKSNVVLRDAIVVPMSLKEVEEASCTNLFQTNSPSVLGIPPFMSELLEFSDPDNRYTFIASTKPENPWQALFLHCDGTEYSPIPVIIDMNTAAWSLKKGASLNERFKLTYDDRELNFVTVGLLSNSPLQGKLLISEGNLHRTIKQSEGYNFFLIRSGSDDHQDQTINAMESGWAEYGMDVTRTIDVMKKLLGVQNTYISAFQSLGALGLLLGTLGLAAVQIRSIYERKREIGLLQAIGFSRPKIAFQILLESALLLIAGLAIGSGSAVIALAPSLIEGIQQHTQSFAGLSATALQLFLVFLFGIAASLLAVRQAMHLPPLESLRRE